MEYEKLKNAFEKKHEENMSAIHSEETDASQRFEIVNKAIADFVKEVEERVDCLQGEVAKTEQKYGEFYHKNAGCKDMCDVTLQLSGEMEKNIKKAKQDILEAHYSKIELIQNPGTETDTHNKCILDYKSKKRNLARLEKLKKETQRGLCRLKEELAYTEQNKEIYEGLMNHGQDLLASENTCLEKITKFYNEHKNDEKIKSRLQNAGKEEYQKIIQETYKEISDILSGEIKYNEHDSDNRIEQ